MNKSMKLGHYPCKNLLPSGIGDKECVCKVTKEWCFRSDQVADCSYRKDRF